VTDGTDLPPPFWDPNSAMQKDGRVMLQILRHMLVATWALTVCGASLAQAPEPQAAIAYPTRPLRLIVPFPAGGGADHWGRLVSKELADKLGQDVIVENIPGAGGNKGTAVAASANPDGYTLLLGSLGPLAVHPFTYSALAFDPERNFVPIALLESSPILLVASRAVSASSAIELIDFARANPGFLSYASNGDGSPEHVAGELFKKRLRLEIRHLPYDGAGPARKAILSGQALLMFDPCKGALPAVRQGLQRPLAVAASARLPELPTVPTFIEVGVSQYELRVWTGVLAPAGTPREIVTKLNQAIRGILSDPEIRKEIADEGGEAGSTTSDGFTAFLRAERRRWSALVDESGIRKVAAAPTTSPVESMRKLAGQGDRRRFLLIGGSGVMTESGSAAAEPHSDN
jgi:tripartite-type tricarboxylate transporter receptor subunit TctC